MILCACKISTLSEQSTKCRSCSGNLQKVCSKSLFKITSVWLSNRRAHFGGNSWGAQVYGLFFLIVLFECWLAGQTTSDHIHACAQWYTKLLPKVQSYLTALIVAIKLWIQWMSYSTASQFDSSPSQREEKKFGAENTGKIQKRSSFVLYHWSMGLSVLPFHLVTHSLCLLPLFSVSFFPFSFFFPSCALLHPHFLFSLLLSSGLVILSYLLPLSYLSFLYLSSDLTLSILTFSSFAHPLFLSLVFLLST